MTSTKISNRQISENLINLNTDGASKKEAQLFEKGIGKSKVGLEVNQLLDAKQLAMRLSLSPWTIRKWRAEKRIPFIRLGRAIRYNFDEVVSSLLKRSKG